MKRFRGKARETRNEIVMELSKIAAISHYFPRAQFHVLSKYECNANNKWTVRAQFHLFENSGRVDRWPRRWISLTSVNGDVRR